MAERRPVSHVLLVPGLFSPRWMMWPLRRSLTRQHPAVETWDDAHVFASAQASVQSLSDRIMATGNAGATVCLVTHSFGDWIARQALAALPEPRVVKLISLVPVLTASGAAQLAYGVGIRCIPEIRIMANAERAAQATRLPARIERSIVWAKFDLWVRRVEVEGVRATTVAGSHNTLVMQPAVHRLVAREIAQAQQD